MKQREVADREALRRVAGLSTELSDVSEVEYRRLRLERVILAGVWTSGSLLAAEASMRELGRLAETAGSLVLGGVVQRRLRPDAATYIGSGRAVELGDLAHSAGADTIVIDGELSGGQLQRLEQIVGVKTVDRTWLILDIFAQHARSREGKAQVALAQLEYLLPRLRGWGEAMSRPGGGIGTRGPGETKIETDRRRIRKRMAKLGREIADMATARSTARRRRRERVVPSVVIVGYTNAGKSSLLNRLAGSDALVHDELFATLDPTVRRCHTESGREFTLADTVGFVAHLPHQLVEAFRSTMEEVTNADLVVHVVDGSSLTSDEQMSAVREVLREVGAEGIRRQVVINKADVSTPDALHGLIAAEPDAIVVSAVTGAGMDLLASRIGDSLPPLGDRVEITLSPNRGDLVARARREGVVVDVAYGADGIELIAQAGPELAAALRDAAIIRRTG